MTDPFESVRAALPAYEIGGELGRGGWGVVLSGRHRHLQRQVAIKQLPPTFAADATVRARFTSEARLLASLDHPHVVPVYDFVEQDGLCLLVMELLPGGTVWSRFKSEGFSAPSAVAVALACAAGLRSAHEHGILHRDVKPENLMFGATGALKVTDFGIAKVVGGGETLATRAGDVLGTPAYMAPEQARGLALTPATDVYALATMLYELLAGVLPFPDDTDAMALLFRHAFDPPTPIEQAAPGIPPALAAVVMRGLATDPAQRFPSAEAFGIALASASRMQWGADWLLSQPVPVLGADTMTTAASAPMAPPTVHKGAPPFTAQPPGAQPTVPAGPHPVPPTVQLTGPMPPANAPTVRAGERVMRPVVAAHVGGVALTDVAEGDLVPVQRVVPSRPVIPFLIATALAVAALIVAAVGLGSPQRNGDLSGHAIRVDDQSAVGGDRVTIDVTQPVVVSVARPPAADQVRLSLEVLGVSALSSDAPMRRNGSATVPALGSRYVLAGRFTGEVTLLRNGQVVGTWQFPVRTTQSPYASAIAVVDALLILFAAAYVESFLRALRRSRSRVTGVVGVPVMSALLAVGAVGASWVALGHEPTVATLVAAVALAACAGIAATVGATRIGRRRRLRRRARQNPVRT